MKWQVVNTLAVVSLGLCVAVLATNLWCIRNGCGASLDFGVGLKDIRFKVEPVRAYFRIRRYATESDAKMIRPTNPTGSPTEMGFKRLGFGLYRVTYSSLVGPRIVASDWYVQAPCWFVVLASGLLPGFLSIRRKWFGWRRRGRVRAGLCPVCGYDLRASTARCPECGTAMPNGCSPDADT